MITVQIEVADTDLSVNPVAAESCVKAAMSLGRINDGSVTVIFSNDKMLRRLKKEFLGEDEYTDVMAFRLDSSTQTSAPSIKSSAEGTVRAANSLEGEIYISVDRAKENAPVYGVSLASELCRLVIHGSLHLLGYEDDSVRNRTQMQKLQEQLLARVVVEDLLNQ